MNPSNVELLAVCEEAARRGGQELLSWRGRFSAREKGAHDLVTDADLASQQAVIGVIHSHFPEHGVLGEESPDQRQWEREYCWIVDPLDGTTNYAHRVPCYAVSIAVAREGELLAGVVYDPERDECFSACRGGGATLNGVPIGPAGTTAIGSALLAVSFPPQLGPDSPDLQKFLRVVTMCQAIRRTGSAALNLAYVASGRFDGHWAHEIFPWDAAAGVLLIQEAGGVATGVGGEPYDVRAAHYLAAATPELHGVLLPLVGR